MERPMNPVQFGIYDFDPKRAIVEYWVRHARNEARVEPFVLETPRILAPHPGTDVVLRATAGPPSPGALSGHVELQVDEVHRRFAVFGPRIAQRSSRGVTFVPSAPMPAIRLSPANEFGGISCSKPFLKNPAGKGYCLDTDHRVEVELPLVEDAACLLRPEHLFTSESQSARLPDPAWAGAVPLGNPSRFTAKLRGRMTDDVRALMPDWGDISHVAPPHARLGTYRPGASVLVEGSGLSYRATLPTPPTVTVTVEGRTSTLNPTPQRIVFEPETESMLFTYVLELALSRPFHPGVHANIPLSLALLGEEHSFATEPPVLPQLLSHPSFPYQL